MKDEKNLLYGPHYREAVERHMHEHAEHAGLPAPSADDVDQAYDRLLATKWDHPPQRTLEDAHRRIEVLEAQVRSLQLSMPKGIPHP